jgi:hypothetical protein
VGFARTLPGLSRRRLAAGGTCDNPVTFCCMHHRKPSPTVFSMLAIIVVAGVGQCSAKDASRSTTSPQPGYASSAAEEPSSARKDEGCKLEIYTGTIPLRDVPNYIPDAKDLRGGMTCRFRVSSAFPLFTFHFAGKPDNTLGDIDITEEPSTTIVQTIENTTDAADLLPMTPDTVLTAVDANFDGYKDLQLLNNCGGTGNCAYEFYLYNPATNRFVRNEFLSNLSTPEFHADKKQVTTHSHGSASDWESDTYRYEDGHYSLIRQEISVWDRDSDTVTESTYELRNGKMELVEATADHQ